MKQVLPVPLVRYYYANSKLVSLLYSSDRCHRWSDGSNHYLSVSSDSYPTHQSSEEVSYYNIINFIKCCFSMNLICVQHLLLS